MIFYVNDIYNYELDTTTDTNGMFIADVPFDIAYTIIASKQGYETNSLLDVAVTNTASYLGMIFLDLISQFCNPDCTLVGTTECSKECDNVTGSTPNPDCSMYLDPVDNYYPCHQRQSYMTPELNSTHVIDCCTGTPRLPDPKITVSDVEVPAKESNVRMTKIVSYKGKLIKMVVDTFG